MKHAGRRKLKIASTKSVLHAKLLKNKIAVKRLMLSVLALLRMKQTVLHFLMKNLGIRP